MDLNLARSVDGMFLNLSKVFTGPRFFPICAGGWSVLGVLSTVVVDSDCWSVWLPQIDF